jgi:hypothetical protein
MLQSFMKLEIALQPSNRLLAPPSVLSNGYRGALPPDLKRLGQAHHSHSSNAEAINGGAISPHIHTP